MYIDTHFIPYLPFSFHKYQIHLRDLQKCHVIDYQQELMHVILSHCTYSLKLGSGTDISYDLPALEKHILDRFFSGRPQIVREEQLQGAGLVAVGEGIPVLAFKGDVLQTFNFLKVRQNITQVSCLKTYCLQIMHNVHS